MRTIDMHQAKANLSHLVDRAAKGEPFIIAKRGKPLVKVMAIDPPARSKIRRLGFLTGKIAVPKDFDQMGSNDIANLFGCTD